MTSPYIILLFLLIPLLQLGASFYISFQMLGILAIILLCSTRKIESRIVFPLALGGAVFLIKITTQLLNPDTQELLLISREAICFFLLIIGACKISQIRNPINTDKIYSIFLIASTILITIQYLAIKEGVFISFPTSWFIMNQETLSGVNFAIYHGTRLRPVGFYGEPSYMAFILISMLAIFLSSTTKSTRFIIATLCANLWVILILGSLSGILAFCAITTTFLYYSPLLNINKQSKIAIAFPAFIITIISAIALTPEFAGRLSGILSGNADEATRIRYVIPFEIISNMLGSGDFAGLSNLYISSIANWRGATSIDNALLNLILHYGPLGILPIAALALHARHPIAIAYILISLNFNGAYFTYDKVVMMSLVIGFCLGSQKISDRVKHYEPSY